MLKDAARPGGVIRPASAPDLPGRPLTTPHIASLPNTQHRPDHRDQPQPSQQFQYQPDLIMNLALKTGLDLRQPLLQPLKLSRQVTAYARSRPIQSIQGSFVHRRARLQAKVGFHAAKLDAGDIDLDGACLSDGEPAASLVHNDERFKRIR